MNSERRERELIAGKGGGRAVRHQREDREEKQKMKVGRTHTRMQTRTYAPT